MGRPGADDWRFGGSIDLSRGGGGGGLPAGPFAGDDFPHRPGGPRAPSRICPVVAPDLGHRPALFLVVVPGSGHGGSVKAAVSPVVMDASALR